MENRERNEPRERSGDGRPGNWNERERERQQPRHDQPRQQPWELQQGGWQDENEPQSYRQRDFGQQGGYRQQGFRQQGGSWQQDPGQQWDYENRGYGQQGFNQRGDYDQQDRGYRQQGGGGYGQQQTGGSSRGGSMQGRYRMQEPRGQYHGKGPRNYRRSDDRIREEVCDLLTEHGEIDASAIEITVANGEVTLKGTVPDRQMKRMAEDIVENVSSVKEITNNLRVQQQQQGKENEEEMEMAGRSSQGDRSGKSSKQS